MAEYIERQKVFDSLPTVVEDKTITLYGAVADFMVLVSAIPAADVVEVKHGRWEEHPQDTFAREHHCEKLRCTHCWHFFYNNYGDNKLYCPNCGARMDGE